MVSRRKSVGISPLDVDGIISRLTSSAQVSPSIIFN
jgi:hypothetical protein